MVMSETAWWRILLRRSVENGWTGRSEAKWVSGRELDPMSCTCAPASPAVRTAAARSSVEVGRFSESGSGMAVMYHGQHGTSSCGCLVGEKFVYRRAHFAQDGAD